jgi:cytochrome oxidase Cu insertion factor (SCO1/SenC/PrrC family)
MIRRPVQYPGHLFFAIVCRDTSIAAQKTLLYGMMKIKKEEIAMARVEMNTAAPDFTLEDFNGNAVRLSDFKGKKHVLLVLNRGFM